MSRPIFVKTFGGVFEHSPLIADRAFRLMYGHSYDAAGDLHKVFVSMFRQADHEQRLAILQAHPDLAGRLARAKKLSAASTGEQASAGLDHLTKEEHSAFSSLNQAYRRKFNFPFIIAVRDHDKASILDAFRRRLGHDRPTELDEACRQVERIALLRLLDLLPSEHNPSPADGPGQYRAGRPWNNR